MAADDNADSGGTAADPAATTGARGARRRPVFVVLEGLSAVGKSTVAPLVAQRLDATLIDALPPEIGQARAYMDRQACAEARAHYWMAVGYLTAAQVRQTLRTGVSVVVESYFYRSHATHAAIGVDPLPAIDWDKAAVPDLAVELVVDEPLRRSRLAGRPGGPHGGRWTPIQETNAGVIERVYRAFGLIRVDVTALSPVQAADRIAELAEGVRRCA